MPLHFAELRGWTTAQDTFAFFYGNHPNCFWLDRQSHPTNRFSVIGSGVPVEVLADSSLANLRAAVGPALGAEDAAANLPFDWRPGLVGVVAYQPSAGASAGDFLSVDRGIVFDHEEKRIYFVADVESLEQFENWHHAALLRLALIGADAARYQIENDAATAALLTAHMPEIEYKQAIQAAQDSIRAGDVYQLCLTTRLRGDFTGDPLAYFLRLRAAHQAPYAGFLRIGGKSFASISPERLLSVAAGVAISTPIKGTRPRGADAESDERLRAELAADSKERAENLMIVDLIRNDLSSVSDPASIAVTALLEVQTFSTLHQLVSEVQARLRQGADAIDALRAVFPGGSMTGAPKESAMALISALETDDRGGYSGGFGYFGRNGSIDIGMVIRTAVFENNQVSIGIGGGLTIDSEADAEHKEIQLKAQALTQALGASVRW